MDDIIEAAEYAVLDGTTHLGRRVLLVMFGHYTALQWQEGDGLHYDGDGTLLPAYLQQKIESGAVEITTDWAECERFVAPLPEVPA